MAGRGRGKQVRTEDSDQLSGSSKKMKMADWCADCWALAADTCREAHRLVDREAAEKDAEAAFKAASKAAAHLQKRLEAEVKAAKLEAERMQERCYALIDARALEGPVLTATIPENEDYVVPSWNFGEGGDIDIAVAATEALTAEDKRTICEVLEDLTIDYEVDESASTVAVGYGHLDADALQGVMAKLADCVEGALVRRGTVLLTAAGVLEVYFVDMPPRVDWGSKVFGRVQDGLDTLEGFPCGGDYCKDIDMTCFCKTEELQEVPSTTLTEVKLSA